MTNTVIRAIREGMRLSQGEFAERIRVAGVELDQPNECSLRTVQRWEQGSISYPRRNMIRALERATGQSVEELGFDHVPRREFFADHDARAAPAVPAPAESPGMLTGIWESRCTYRSSSRGEEFLDLAHLVLVQAGDEISARSIEDSVTDGSTVTMRLGLRGHVATGTWEEVTGDVSYYRGMTFHGALQLQVEASGARMRGMWCGFGRDFDVNAGPWELIRRERGTANTDAYAHVPDE